MKSVPSFQSIDRTVPITRGLTCSQPQRIPEQAVYQPVTIVPRHPPTDNRNRPEGKIPRCLSWIQVYLDVL